MFIMFDGKGCRQCPFFREANTTCALSRIRPTNEEPLPAIDIINPDEKPWRCPFREIGTVEVDAYYDQ